MHLHARTPYIPGSLSDVETVPFSSAEEAWFWFVQAHTARQEGARVIAGFGPHARPCEPVDILAVLERLYRNRRLLMDHVLVLRFYGRRMTAPDPRRTKEARACGLWREALDRLEEPLVRKGIVRKEHWTKQTAGETNHDRDRNRSAIGAPLRAGEVGCLLG